MLCFLNIKYLFHFNLALEILSGHIRRSLKLTFRLNSILGFDNSFFFTWFHKLLSQFAIIFMGAMIFVFEIIMTLTIMPWNLIMPWKLYNLFRFFSKYCSNLILIDLILTGIPQIWTISHLASQSINLIRLLMNFPIQHIMRHFMFHLFSQIFNHFIFLQIHLFQMFYLNLEIFYTSFHIITLITAKHIFS